MRERTIWLSSFALGAASAFLLDPISGRRRRHRLADAAVRVKHQATDAASTIGRDFRNRARGLIAAARHRLAGEQPAVDVVLEERVHSALGRVVVHPHAITVKVHDGHVVLDGPIRPAEEHRMVHAARAVPGVRSVEIRFDRHIQPAYEPSSENVRPGVWKPFRTDMRRRNWAPTTRAIVAGTGVALVGTGMIRRDRIAVGLAVAGAALIARTATNLPFRRLVGIGTGRRAIDLRKAVTAPARIVSSSSK